MTSSLDSYTVLSLTQRWVLIDGAWYREAWIEDAAGCVRFVAILDVTCRVDPVGCLERATRAARLLS
jgi:hypothetical protein